MAGPMSAGFPGGGQPVDQWFPDPMGKAPLRQWTGSNWGSLVSDGTTVWSDPCPVRRRLGSDDLAGVVFVARVFLPEAEARGIVRADERVGFRRLLDDLATEARAGEPAGPKRSGLTPPVPQGATASPAMPVMSPVGTPDVASARSSRSIPPVRPMDAAAGPVGVSANVPVRQDGAPAGLPVPPPPFFGAPAGPPVSPPPAPPFFAAPAGLPVPPPPPLPPAMPVVPAWPMAPPSGYGPQVQAVDPAVAARREARRVAWERLRGTVGSDLGVHGLAYLGVLFLFVGMFGMVAFAFADVTPGLRPVAELVAAVVPFVSAWMLLRSGAGVVGRAVEVVGGLLVPIMLITSMVDGFPIPPDLDGNALVIALTVGCLVCALAYALWSWRYPSSGVRYIVGPAVWLAAAMGTIGVGRVMPVGQDVAVPSSYQAMAMAAALVLTLGLARLLPQTRLADPALTAGGSGAVIVAMLAVLSWASGDRPAPVVAFTGVLLLVVLELVRPRMPGAVADLVEPIWWGAVAIVVAGLAAGGPVAAGAAAGFLVLLELAGHRRSQSWALVLPGAGLAICLGVVALADAWWGTGALVAAALWAAARRTRPFDHAAGVLDLAAFVLPPCAVVAFGAATSVSRGVLAGTGLLVVAAIIARLGVLGRTAGEAFWAIWWKVMTPILTVVSLVAWAQVGTGMRWWLAGAQVVVALTVLVVPMSPKARPWVMTSLAGLAWVLVCEIAGIPPEVRCGVLAIAGLVMVVVALRPSTAAASLGLTGHVTSTVAFAFSTQRWVGTAVMAVITVGWIVTAARGRRSPVWQALSRAADPLKYLPWAVVAMWLPATVAAVLDTAGVLRGTDPWEPVVLASTAVIYAGIVRFGGRGLLADVALWASFVAGVLGAVVPSVGLVVEPWPTVVGLAALVAAVVLLPAARRAPLMRWTAWVAVTPMLGLLARQTVPWFGALSEEMAVAVSCVGIGGVMLIGATALDPRAILAGPPRPGRGAPLLIGALEVGVALFMAVMVVPSPDAVWVAMACAAVTFVVAVLTRTGSLAALAVLIEWCAVVRIAWAWLNDHPLVSVAVGAGLLLVAEAAHRWLADRRTWSRWDIPMLVMALPVALTGLAAAADGDQYAVTFAVVGVLTAAVGVRLHRERALAEVLGVAGTGLVLTGTSYAGSGWTALALLALGAVHTGLAVRARGSERVTRQLVGVAAVIASWLVALDWFAWASQASLEVTAVGAGVVVLLASVVAQTWRGDLSWAVVWGGAGVAVVAVTTLVSYETPGPAVSLSMWIVVGLAAVAVGTGAAAEPLRMGGLRDLAAVTTLTATIASLDVTNVSLVTRATILSAVAAVLAVLTVALALRWPRRAWVRPGVELGVGAAVVAVLIGLSAGSAALVPAIAATAVQVAAAGVALRSVGLQMAAPPLACEAWLLYVMDTDRPPQWFTVAIGCALLAVESIWRRDRRQRQVDVAGGVVIAFELLGIAFLVGGFVVQALTESVVYALLVVALGAAVAGWGALTRVRRRVGAGVVVVLVAAVLLVVVPLVRLLPQWGGAGAWLMLAGVGLIAVIAATMMERGRTVVRAGRGRIRELTAGWE